MGLRSVLQLLGRFALTFIETLRFLKALEDSESGAAASRGWRERFAVGFHQQRSGGWACWGSPGEHNA